LFDRAVAPNGGAPGTPLACSVSAGTSEAWRDEAAVWLRIAGWEPHVVGDAPGLVVARTVAMLINEGADAVQQGVCSPEGADLAMKLGVNHPAGPFEFLARWDAVAVATLLGHLDAHYRGERYRVGPWLRERAWLALLDATSA
ncbi:MAG: 3-hydroxyacyl-CoA dehydrogenase family protein, partial [Pseudomonadota bacterium]|nr:3-hydroxyacyl-CoA dehydrogenase family protein [Pseudomonadota bacterium]